MGKECIRLSSKLLTQAKARLTKAGINIGSLTREELEATLSQLCDEGIISKEITLDNILKNRKVIMDAIASAREESLRVRKELKKVKESLHKIGSVPMVINNKTGKNDTRRSKDTLFIFTDNLQAHDVATSTQSGVEGLVMPKDGVTINVATTSAVVRTDSEGTVQDNAIGIVVKKNAQTEDGRWIGKTASSEEKALATFQESDRESFNRINSAILDKIAELTKEGSQFARVSLPSSIAMKNAGLPRVLAEDLQKLLEEKLGIFTQLLPSEFGENLYGLEIQQEPKKGTKGKGVSQAVKEAMESLKSSRPVSITTTRAANNKLLMRVFPDIATRRARINLIAQMFNRQLDIELEKLRQNPDLDSETKDILNYGSRDAQRKEALKQVSSNGVTTSSKIVGDLRRLINAIGSKEAEDGSISEDDIKEVIEVVIQRPNNVFGTEYAIESETSEVSDKVLRRRAKNIIQFCSIVSKSPGVFEGLMDAASNILEQNENIKLSMDKSQVFNTASDSQNIDDEGSAETRDGLNLVKYKFLDPKTTLSYRIKSLLAKSYKVDRVVTDEATGRKIPIYQRNEFGMRIPISAGAVYYKLLSRFSKMNSSSDFMPMLDAVEEEYPWFSELASQIRQDSDLRNEFYRCFRQVSQIYAVITPRGTIQYKNATLDASALIDMVTKNYEGCNVLSQTSLYNEEGMINQFMVEKFRRLSHIGKADKKHKNEDLKDKHPLAFAISTLNSSSRSVTVGNLEYVHRMLKGELSDVISLDNILKSIGIDTSDMDLSILLPNIDWEVINTLDDVDKVWSKDARNKVYTILQSLQVMTNERTGLKPDSRLIDDFRSTYLRISNSLTNISEGYTQASFYFDGNQRFSYTHPDYISKVIGIISDVSSQEAIDRGTEFIEENFLKFDFYKDSPLFLQLRDDLDARKKFFRCDILAVQTDPSDNSAGNTSIAKCSDWGFLSGLIAAYFSGSTAIGSDGEVKEYGLFRNPLFSDTEALSLFRLPKFSRGDYKSKIIDYLVEMANAEIQRMQDYTINQSNGIVVTNYNDKRGNAGKFCFLTELNPMRDEILAKKRELKNKHTSTTAFNAEWNSYLRDIISRQMDESCTAFISDMSNAEKLKLWSVIRKNVDNSTKTLEEQNFSEDSESLGEWVVGQEEEENSEEEERELTGEEKTKKAREEEHKIKEVESYLEEFFYNDYYTQSQLIMMLGGDLAYYKNIRDFIKRNKQSYASGEKIWALNEDGTPMVERAIYLKDRMMVSNSLKSIQTLLSDVPTLTSFEKELMLGSLRAYADITTTDGQALRTLKSFKKIYKAMGGVWTDAMDTAFDKIRQGQPDLESWTVLVNAIKPFMYSHEVRTINGRLEKIAVQHKNSEYLISALFTTLNTALNSSPELLALQQFMELHDIDVIQFESCVKVGGFGFMELNYSTAAFGSKESFDKWYKEQVKELMKGSVTQEEFNDTLSDFTFAHNQKDNDELARIINNRLTMSEEDYIKVLEDFQKSHPFNALVHLELQMATLGEEAAMHTLPMEDYILAQPNSDHLTDAEALIGSQARNILPADLPDDFEIDVNVGGKKVRLNKEQFLMYYDTLFVDQVLDNFSGLDTKFTNIQSVKALLDSAMENNPKYGEEIKAALELDETGRRFKVSPNNPIVNNKVQDLLLSLFKNNIQRLHIDGGNAVLVSNFSLSDELHVKYRNDDPKQGVEYIPAYMPAFSMKIYKDYLKEVTHTVNGRSVTYYTIDFEEAKKNGVDEELFNMIGYRIPTEDKYSMMPIRVVGFLPIQAGGTIMLPNDIITMSGTDFDIDKLFLMRKSFKRELASRDLGDRFVEWVSQNKPSEVEAAKNLIKQGRRQGFTGEELESLYNKSELFVEFLDNTDSLYEHPKYIPYKARVVYNDGVADLDATSRMEGVRPSMRRLIRNNMIVDIFWDVLTSPEGSRKMMTPATYVHTKVSSRQNIILNNPQTLKEFKEKYRDAIKKYGSIYEAINHIAQLNGHENTPENNISELEKFNELYASGDNPLDIRFYLSTHRNLMDGNGLIGGLAVGSSRHYKFQLCTKETTENGQTKKSSSITLRESNRFKIHIPGYGTHTISEIDPRISPITGAPVGRILSELQAASPDNGKDPVLGDMGINMLTLPQTNFMGAIGLPVEAIGFLNNLGDLVDKGLEYLAIDKKFKSKFKLGEYVCDLGSLSNIAAKVRLGEDLTGTEAIELKNFALWWKNLLQCAGDLNSSSVFFRTDSPNGALAVSSAEAIQQMLKIKELQHKIKYEDFSIDGLDEVIDLDLGENLDEFNTEEGFDLNGFRRRILAARIPRLQAWYSCGLKGAMNLVRRYLPELSSVSLDAVQKLEFLTGLEMTNNTVVLRKFLNEMVTFMLTKDTLFAEGDIMKNRNYYIHDFPMHFKKFLEETDDSGNYIHKDIRNLTLIKMLTNTSKNGIKFYNVGGKVSPESRQYMVEALDYMLSHSDPKVNDFGIDLFMYSFFENGLNFGHSNFGIFFSANFVEAMPGFTQRLHESNDRLLAGDTSEIDNFIDQFLMNHPDLINKYTRKNHLGAISADEGMLEKNGESISFDPKRLTSSSKNKLFRVNKVTGKYEFVKFIKVRRRVGNEYVTDIYKFDGYKSSNVTYNRVDVHKTKNSPAFYDASRNSDQIAWGELKSKGSVISSKIVEKEEAKKAKGKNKENSIPTESMTKVPTDAEPNLSGKVVEERQENEASSMTVPTEVVYHYQGQEVSSSFVEDQARRFKESVPEQIEEFKAMDITKVDFTC